MSIALSLACLFIGDETAQRVSYFKPECAIAARPEATSMTMLNFKPTNKYERVYISVGANGFLNKNMGPNLFEIRKRYKGSAVTWIAPRNTRSAQLVFETAIYFHDQVVYVGKVRPKGVLRQKDYKAIAKQL